MDEFVYRIIKERRREPWEVLEEKTDLLSRFICLERHPSSTKNEAEEEANDEDGLSREERQKFSDKYLRDIIINFFIAGRDTTGLLITWTFYILSQLFT